jgi:hypothetical protein
MSDRRQRLREPTRAALAKHMTPTAERSRQ